MLKLGDRALRQGLRQGLCRGAHQVRGAVHTRLMQQCCMPAELGSKVAPCMVLQRSHDLQTTGPSTEAHLCMDAPFFDCRRW